MAKTLDLRSIVKQAGGTCAVARECGLSNGAVSHWLKNGCLPISDVQGKTDHANTLIRLAGLKKVDVWDLRLLGRR